MDKATTFLLLLGLAACSGETGGPAVADIPSQPINRARSAEAAVPKAPSGGRPEALISLPRLPASDAGDAAALRGRLVSNGSCLYVEAGGERYLIAALSSALQWDARARRLVGAGGGGVRVGEEVVIGGSQVSAGASLPWTETPAAGCDTRRVWIATTVAKA